MLFLVPRAQCATPDYLKLAQNWYAEGVQKADVGVVMDGLADDVQWWCFGAPGFAMNGYYSGKQGANGVGTFFQRLVTETQVDDTKDFHPRQWDASGNVVNVQGVEVGPITKYMLERAPALKGDTFFNYFHHRLEFNSAGKIAKFRCTWNLSDRQIDPEPF